MSSGVKKITVSIFFIGLLTTPVVINNWNNWFGTDRQGVTKNEALDRHGFYLEDVTEKAGIKFRHQRPDLDSKLDHILPQIASLGASVSVVDVNNDSLPDFYVTNSKFGTNNTLYKNLGSGRFEDVAVEMGVATLNTQSTGVSMGSIWGDYNNDGFEDLFLYKWGKPELFKNMQGDTLVAVSDKAGLPDWLNANTAIWFDYNRDGLLDLFIGGYYRKEINLWNLKDTKIMPDSYEYATNGAANYLFKNQGNGTFKDVTQHVGLESKKWTLAAGTADLNNSGYPDLVIANDYGIDELFINRDGVSFENIGSSAGVGFSPKSGMSVSFADLLNQGRLAFYVTNISEPGVLVQWNSLWMPVPGADKLKFTNLAGSFNIEMGGWSYGGQFGDLNRDGYQDLYVANGYISDEPGTDYWYDFSKVAGGYTNIIEDAKNWPAMEGRSLSGFQQNRIWINDGVGKFREVSTEVGGKLMLDSRAVAFADFFNNGTLDIVVATQNGPLKLYKNTAKSSSHWIAFHLNGTTSNKSAFGTQVQLYWNNQSQLQTVHGGSAFSSQNQRSLFFGLGEAKTVEKAVIRWPSGREQILKNPKVDMTHYIIEQEKIN